MNERHFYAAFLCSGDSKKSEDVWNTDKSKPEEIFKTTETKSDIKKGKISKQKIKPLRVDIEGKEELHVITGAKMEIIKNKWVQNTEILFIIGNLK